MSGADLVSALGGKLVPFDLNGVALWLRPLTANDLLMYQAAKTDNAAASAVALIALSVVDEAGGRMLTAEQAGTLPVKAAEALAMRIASLNGFEGTAGKAS